MITVSSLLIILSYLNFVDTENTSELGVLVRRKMENFCKTVKKQMVFLSVTKGKIELQGSLKITRVYKIYFHTTNESKNCRGKLKMD